MLSVYRAGGPPVCACELPSLSYPSTVNSLSGAASRGRRGVYLGRADGDGLLADDPGDALQQRGCGQGAVVGPVVKATGQKGCRVEAGEGGLVALRGKRQENSEPCVLRSEEKIRK